MIFDFNKGFDDDSSIGLSRRVRIAISANIIDESSALHFAYSQAIIEAGGSPLIIPANCDAQTLRSIMMDVDALLFSGGADIDARYFGEENIPDITDLDLERDRYDFMLLRAAIDRSVPILGICRGAQVINIALGGSIYQDLPSEYPKPLLEHSILRDKHLPVHNVTIVEGTKLHNIIQESQIGVNSRHHQAIKALAPSLTIAARSEDGVVEAIEGYPAYNILAVQWHPENMATKGQSEAMKRLFAHLISEAELYRRAREIHQKNIIIDSHCDTPMLYQEAGFDFALRNSAAQVDLVKMIEGGVDATITVAYISQATPESEKTEMALTTLRRFRADIAAVGDRVGLVRSITEITEAKRRGAKSILLGVENGAAIGGDISNIDLFKAEGVVYITLCHNGSNTICDSAIGEAIHDGVSEFGASVIERMNQLGITIDISHSSEKSTLDALRLSRQPIIASHSSAKALCDHPRNLSDSTIKAISAAGGVVQVCGYGGFLSLDGDATVATLVDHIEHIIALSGYDHVGVGSDFDGGGGIAGFMGANNFINITTQLLRRGHREEDIAKIMGGNISRIIGEI